MRARMCPSFARLQLCLGMRFHLSRHRPGAFAGPQPRSSTFEFSDHHVRRWAKYARAAAIKASHSQPSAAVRVARGGGKRLAVPHLQGHLYTRIHSTQKKAWMCSKSRKLPGMRISRWFDGLRGNASREETNATAQPRGAGIMRCRPAVCLFSGGGIKTIPSHDPRFEAFESTVRGPKCAADLSST